MIYKQIGGCTNPSRKKFEDIDKDYIYHSDCIDKSKITTENLLNDGKTCPFYNICNSFNCSYEKLKDTWIAKEMKGGIGEREREKLEVALMLFEEMTNFNIDKGQFRLNAKNGKELKLKIKMKLPTMINTKYTGVEVDDIIQTTISLLDMQFLEDTCKIIDIDHKVILDRIIARDNLEKPKPIENKSYDKKSLKDFEDDSIISIIKKDKKLYIDLIEYAKQLQEDKEKSMQKIEEQDLSIDENKENGENDDESNNEKI